MRFGRWLLLQEALLAIPAGPGLFQLRVTTGLLVFPGGRSAMVAYGGGEDLPAALQTFLSGPAGARAAALGPLLCRFGAPDGHRSAAETLSSLRRRFIEQFGAPPGAEQEVP